MACIGCHDCMLACPLPEARTITITELNAAVHLPVIRAENVAAFVAACTQCRQCVPACPADLSRADMVLFNKMKVEDQVPNQQLFLQCGDDVQPSPFTLDSLANQLTLLALFDGVSAEDLRRLVLKITLRRLGAGEQLCGEGEFHERMYVVLQGALEQSSEVAGRRTRILVLSPGAFFGELAVMADQAEPFTVTALDATVVLEIPKAAIHRLISQSPPFAQTMDELYRRRALWTYSQKSPVLNSLPEQALQQLMAGASLVPHESGDHVFKEGDAPRDVFLVRSGFYKVSARHGNDEVVLVYFREGDLFGAIPLLWNEPGHSVTVQASSRAEVVRIGGSALAKTLAAYPQARAALEQGGLGAEQVARSGLAQLRAKPATPQQQATAGSGAPATTMFRALAWENLVEHGVAKGSQVLVVDQNRCTNCQGCIDACGRRHGYSRLQLRGVQFENLLFPTACRHCEDPVCLLCSVNGIVRLPSGEITIQEDNCVGCGACADRCPYGNIQMHAVNKPKRGLLSGVWQLIFGKKAQAAETIDDPKIARIAVKCDLCAGHDDYACVSACPVGAAARIDPTSVLGDDTTPLGLRGGH